MASPPDPEDFNVITGIATTAALAVTWFIYYLRRGMGAPAVDPETKKMLEDIRHDVERFEDRLTSLVEAVKDVQKDIIEVKRCQAVIKNDVRHNADEINRMRK